MGMEARKKENNKVRKREKRKKIKERGKNIERRPV